MNKHTEDNLWPNRYSRNSTEERKQVSENLYGFFHILHFWNKQMIKNDSKLKKSIYKK